MINWFNLLGFERDKTPKFIPLPVDQPKAVDQANQVAALKRQVEQLIGTKAELERTVRERSVAPKPFTPGTKFVVAIPFCSRDAMQAADLLRWVRQLEGKRLPGRVLLCAQFSCPEVLANEVRLAAGQAFAEVEFIQTTFDLPNEAWPTGTCWMFLHIARHCLAQRYDFWLNEPDCIPLKAGWRDALETEYRECGKPYMGFIEPAPAHGGYPRHMTGNAVYNWQVFNLFRADALGKAWDVAMADVLLPLAHHTRLFHQEFGPLDHPPTFATVDDLDRLPKDAMIFHRNKDGTLIKWLRDRLTYAPPCTSSPTTKS